MTTAKMMSIPFSVTLLLIIFSHQISATARGKSPVGADGSKWKQIGTSVRRSVSSSVSVSDIMDDISTGLRGFDSLKSVPKRIQESTRVSLFTGPPTAKPLKRKPRPPEVFTPSGGKPIPPGFPSSFKPSSKPSISGGNRPVLPPGGGTNKKPVLPPGGGLPFRPKPGTGVIRPPAIPTFLPPAVFLPDGGSGIQPPGSVGTTDVLPGSGTSDKIEVKVSDIRCVQGRRVSTFQAFIRPPQNYMATPLIHNIPSIDLLTDPFCQIKDADNVGILYQLFVSDFKRCGVEECNEDGKTFFCITLRFPLLNGLQLPEDEKVAIKCETQDLVAEDTRGIELPTSEYFSMEREASIHEGGGQFFHADIALYQRNSPNTGFTSRIVEGVELELGQQVQLQSIVNAEDGWRYSRLVDVIVHSDLSPTERTNKNTAILVFSNGCNNEDYTAVAPERPQQEPGNALLNKFNFRVFLFQDMKPGENLMITAKVIGCVEIEDCTEPNDCSRFQRQTFQRRKKRGLREMTISTTLRPSEFNAKNYSDIENIPLKLTPPPGIIQNNPHDHGSRPNSTAGWQRSLSLKVKNPNPATIIQKREMSPPQCQIYLFLTVGVAAAFFLATVVFVITVLAKRRNQLESKASASPATSTTSVGVRPVYNGESKFVATSESTLASSHSESNNSGHSRISDSESDEENHQMPWMPQVFVPATVRHRKRKVNHELMDAFGNGMATCPPLLNYYGYMVVPTKAASTGYNTMERPKHRHRSAHSTLDRKIDSSVFLNSDLEDSSSDFEMPQMKSHRDIYRRRQKKYADRSKSREIETGYRKKSQERNRNISQIKIEGPPLPPQRPLPRIRTTTNEEHFYETPVDNRPVMV